MSLSQTQQDFILSLLGEKGDWVALLRDTVKIEVFEKIAYLKQAITEDCITFLTTLDELYALSDDLELVRILKYINDLYFNHEVKNGEYGVSSAWEHWFKHMGALDGEALQHTLNALIEAEIKQLQGTQETERKRKREVTPNPAWREQMDLPLAQLPATQPVSPTSPPTFFSDPDVWLNRLLEHNFLSSEAVFQLTEAQKENLQRCKIFYLIWDGVLSVIEAMNLTVLQRLVCQDNDLWHLMTGLDKTIQDIPPTAQDYLYELVLGCEYGRCLLRDQEITWERLFTLTEAECVRLKNKSVREFMLEAGKTIEDILLLSPREYSLLTKYHAYLQRSDLILDALNQLAALPYANESKMRAMLVNGSSIEDIIEACSVRDERTEPSRLSI